MKVNDGNTASSNESHTLDEYIMKIIVRNTDSSKQFHILAESIMKVNDGNTESKASHTSAEPLIKINLSLW